MQAFLSRSEVIPASSQYEERAGPLWLTNLHASADPMRAAATARGLALIPHDCDAGACRAVSRPFVLVVLQRAASHWLVERDAS
jgi:hypothetical protein